MIRFAPPDLERDRKILLDQFFKTYMADDPCLDEEGEAARETMFDRLVELAKVVTDVKKGLKKKK